MSIAIRGLILLAAIGALGLAHPAGAAELADFTAAEDAKRITLRFRYSGPVKPDVIYHYQHNFVALRASGLKIPAARLKGDAMPPSEDAALAYRFVRFQQDSEGGEARIYLQKPLTPADAQVIPYENYTEVVLLKPSRPVTPPSADTPAQDPPTEPPAADAPPTADDPPADSPVQDPPAQPAVDEPAADEPTVDDPAAVDPPVQPDMPAQPEAPVGGPSYAQFDLSQVAVRQLEFRGVPFREALSELVAGSGFNVIVGDEVDNAEVVLNFTQKQLSLKSALDLLAMAYDISWSVQPDAIVITAK